MFSLFPRFYLPLSSHFVFFGFSCLCFSQRLDHFFASFYNFLSFSVHVQRTSTRRLPRGRWFLRAETSSGFLHPRTFAPIIKQFIFFQILEKYTLMNRSQKWEAKRLNFIFIKKKNVPTSVALKFLRLIYFQFIQNYAKRSKTRRNEYSLSWVSGVQVFGDYSSFASRYDSSIFNLKMCPESWQKSWKRRIHLHSLCLRSLRRRRYLRFHLRSLLSFQFDSNLHHNLHPNSSLNKQLQKLLNFHTISSVQGKYHFQLFFLLAHCRFAMILLKKRISKISVPCTTSTILLVTNPFREIDQFLQQLFFLHLLMKWS